MALEELELGAWLPGFASWGRTLSNSNDSTRETVFTMVAREAVGYVGKGMAKPSAIDALVDLAEAHGLTDQIGREAVEAIIHHAFEAPAPSEAPAAKPNGAGPRLRLATPYVLPNEADIPKRGWLYGGHYIRQAATATVAPGGFGKTTLTIHEAVSMVAAGLSVWYVSGEDPRVEIDRRIAAHCRHHGVDLRELPGKLYVDDKTSFPLAIATAPRTGVVKFDDNSLLQFEHAIMADDIAVVMIDPFVSFHTVPENDNGAIDAVIKRLAAIAQRTDSCIEISHHVRKPFTGQGAITVDDARGGSALINAVRSGRVINRMTMSEAEQAKIDEENRHFYIRVDRGKRNMAPPDKVTWFQLVSVILSNGDNVQALDDWKFPNLWDGVSVEDTEWVRSLVRAKAYRCDSRSADWLGIEIAKRLHLNVNAKADCTRINKMIGIWLSNGVFKKVEMKDDGRRMRMFYAGIETTTEAAEEKSNVVPLFDSDD
jgi:AAA domain